MEKFAKIKEIIAAIEADVEKFYMLSNKASGTRLRKALLETKKLAQAIRVEIMEIKNS